MNRLSLFSVLLLSLIFSACSGAPNAATMVAETQSAGLSISQTQTAAPTPTPLPTLAPGVSSPGEPAAAAQSAAAGTVAADAQTAAELCDAAPAAEPTTRTYTQAEQVLQPDADYYAIFCTAAGPVYVDLLEDETPITVNNLVFLAENDYYNNTTFHRVLKNPPFMAQGGDPEGTGMGGPGYTFADEFVPTLNFDRPGLLAMANSGPATNGSQFFITYVPTTHLNQRHTIFGRVLEGMTNLNNLTERDPQLSPTEPGPALKTILILTDPSQVRLSEKTPPAREAVVQALDGVDALIGPEVTALLTNQKANYTTEEAVAAAPETARETLRTLFTTHNHQYEVSSRLENTGCDRETIGFLAAGYTLDLYASPADASAAIADPAMAQFQTERGYDQSVTSTLLPAPVFFREVTVCDAPAINAVSYWQRGAFVATAEVTLPRNSNGVDSLDRVLLEFTGGQIYEPLLADIFYWDIQ